MTKPPVRGTGYALANVADRAFTKTTSRSRTQPLFDARLAAIAYARRHRRFFLFIERHWVQNLYNGDAIIDLCKPHRSFLADGANTSLVNNHSDALRQRACYLNYKQNREPACPGNRAILNRQIVVGPLPSAIPSTGGAGVFYKCGTKRHHFGHYLARSSKLTLPVFV